MLHRVVRLNLFHLQCIRLHFLPVRIRTTRHYITGAAEAAYTIITIIIIITSSIPRRDIWQFNKSGKLLK